MNTDLNEKLKQYQKNYCASTIIARTAYDSLGRTTSKNGSAGIRSSNYVFYNSVRYPWKIYMKSEVIVK